MNKLIFFLMTIQEYHYIGLKKENFLRYETLRDLKIIAKALITNIVTTSHK